MTEASARAMQTLRSLDALFGRLARLGTPVNVVMIIVLRLEAAEDRPCVVGLRVDRVIEVSTLDDAGAAPLVEADLLRWRERMVAGIGRRNGAFVTVLDVAGLFETTPDALLPAAAAERA